MKIKRFLVPTICVIIGMACNIVAGLFPPSAEGAITAFSGEDNGVDDQFLLLEELIETDPEEVRAAAMRHLADEDGGVRYAALYALAQTAEEGESLQSLVLFLSSEDISERMLAAEALLARGEKAAFPVLIDALDSDEYLAYRDPPQQAWEAAVFALIQFTDEHLGLLGVEGLAGSSDAKPAWEAWWLEYGARLIWNADDGVYER